VDHIHLFEFTDQAWYPEIFRSMQTDYLQFAASLGSGHKNLLPLFEKALHRTGTSEILDLCSGSGGPWFHLRSEMEKAGLSVNVRLSDKFPQPDAISRQSSDARQGITYLSESVDAFKVPPHLRGMRTIFEGFHHFKPGSATAILRDAMQQKAAIGIFEVNLKQPFLLMLAFAPLATLLAYLLVTPFIKPRRFSRFLWTYIIPLVPLATCWDGIISLLRVYTVSELEEMIEPLQQVGYVWEAGEVSTGTPFFVFTYLIGYPDHEPITT
jgi:hypothetical protein